MLRTALRKARGDAEAYGQRVYAAAAKAAEASKEGGFLGFGGTTVSEAEKAALGDLRGLLRMRV